MFSRYNREAIRELILAAFSADEILNLASDLFPNVLRNFAPGMSNDQIARNIVDEAERHGRYPALLDYIKKRRRARYAQHEPDLQTPLTIAELEALVASQQNKLIQYESLESIEDDPQQRQRLLENIEAIKNQLLALQTRIARLKEAQQPTPKSASPTADPTTIIANVPYGLETELVGRIDEMLLLDDWFQRDPDHPFLAVIGLGGIGKSALTWDWLQRIHKKGQAPRLVVWWSFYEADGTMQKLLVTLLRAFGDDPTPYTTLRSAVDRCTYYLQRVKVLLMLDGAERLLRAYGNMGAAYQADALESGLEFQQARQCIDPAAGALLNWLAQPGLTQAQTLMTSRLLPRELTGRTGQLLTGVRRHDLTGLTPDAAVDLFRKAGIRAGRAEVIAAAQPLGYHPLSLRLLAGYAANDLGLPNDLRAAADYAPDAELLGRRTHILQRAYDSLPQTAQLTLSRLAAFRGGVEWPVIESIFGDSQKIRADLKLLENRSLLQRTDPLTTDHSPLPTIFDLHPIVRRYAYDRLTNPAATHSQLIIYFQAVPAPAKIQTLTDLTPTIELYHHLARAGQYDEAEVLFYDRLASPLYFQFGAYQQVSELLRVLFPDGEDKLPRLKEESNQAWTLNALANSYSLAARPNSAVPLYEQVNAIYEKMGNKKNLAIGLGAVASVAQMPIGALETADANLRRSIDLCREVEDRFQEASGHKELGRLLAYCGDWAGAEAEFNTALEQDTAGNVIQGQGLTWAYRALAALLQGQGQTAEQAATEALRLADMHGLGYPVERDYVRAYWLLGWAALVNGELALAGRHLDQALSRCRAINAVMHEPAILLAQARLARAKANHQQASEYAAEAQTIAERAGYLLDLADIDNLLAQLALDQGQKAEAHDHATQAKAYAHCDGPPFSYKAAHEEAERLLLESR